MIYNNLGLLYFNNKPENNVKKIENYYKKAISIDEKSPEPHNNLGNLYNYINKYQEAANCYNKAIIINSQFLQPYYNLANVNISIGEIKEAKQNLLEAIKLNPKFYNAHRLLSRIIKYTSNEKHYEELKKIHKNIEENQMDDKLVISFALGKASEDIKKYDESFDFYMEANSLYRKKINFSLKDEKSKFDEIKNIFNEKLFNKFKNIGIKNNSPIFIVGMPRSGTTLVEQILSSHSKVFGAGEVENYLI